MNSYKQLLITAILAFAVLANVSVGAVYATGGLDDEEEEQAIEELQSSVGSINETLDKIELNLQEGSNNIQANCPISTDEIVDEITEVIKNVTNNQQQQQQPEQEATVGCPLVTEEEQQQPEQNQSTVIPTVVAEPEQ